MNDQLEAETADCTIAATRADGGGGVLATSSASTIVRFQSLTTLALAAPGAANTANPIAINAKLLNIADPRSDCKATRL